MVSERETSPSAAARLWGRLAGSSLATNAARLFTGAVLGQLVTVLTSMVTVRLYGMANFGLAASFISAAGIIASAGCFRYDMALMLPREDEEVRSLWSLAVWIMLLITAVTAGLVALGVWLWEPLWAQLLGSWMWLLPGVVLLTTFVMLLSTWANRQRTYRLLASVRPFGAVVAASLSIGLGLLNNSSPGGLLLGNLGTQAAIIVGLLFGLSRVQKQPPALLSPCDPVSRRSAVRYRQFPFFNLPMTLADQLTAGLPVMLFVGAFGAGVGGAFSLAVGVLRMPAALIGQAVAQVFFEQASRAQHDAHQLRQLVKKCSLFLALPAAAMLLAILLLGPMLFSLVFGAASQTAGEFSRILVFSSALILVLSPISTLPSILGQQRGHMLIALAGCGLRLLGTLLGVWLGSEHLAITCFVAGELAGGLWFAAWLWQKLRVLPDMLEHPQPTAAS